MQWVMDFLMSSIPSGAKHGLTMTLNIQQYEYMTGPTPGAGVRILLHDQHDFPLVGAYGVSVPPGTHAFLPMKIEKVCL